MINTFVYSFSITEAIFRAYVLSKTYNVVIFQQQENLEVCHAKVIFGGRDGKPCALFQSYEAKGTIYNTTHFEAVSAFTRKHY